MMVSCHEMMISCHEMTILCHDMTIWFFGGIYGLCQSNIFGMSFKRAILLVGYLCLTKKMR